MIEPRCFAATIEPLPHGTVARCGIQGHVQMAVHDGTPAVCCDEYWDCAIWRGEKERLWAHRHAQRAASAVRTDSTGRWETL